MDPASEQLIRDYTASPKIDFLRIVLLCDLLGRHVDESACSIVLTVAVVLLGTKAEVHYLNLRVVDIVIGEKDILWFQIAVHDITSMDIGHTFQ